MTAREADREAIEVTRQVGLDTHAEEGEQHAILRTCDLAERALEHDSKVEALVAAVKTMLEDGAVMCVRVRDGGQPCDYCTPVHAAIDALDKGEGKA